MPGIDREKLRSLCSIMEKAHALAEVAWPRDGCGVSAMPNEALLAIMDIQAASSVALGGRPRPDDRRPNDRSLRLVAFSLHDVKAAVASPSRHPQLGAS